MEKFRPTVTRARPLPRSTMLGGGASCRSAVCKTDFAPSESRFPSGSYATKRTKMHGNKSKIGNNLATDFGVAVCCRWTQQEDSAKNEAEMSAAIGPPKLSLIVVSMARPALVIFAPFHSKRRNNSPTHDGTGLHRPPPNVRPYYPFG